MVDGGVSKVKNLFRAEERCLVSRVNDGMPTIFLGKALTVNDLRNTLFCDID